MLKIYLVNELGLDKPLIYTEKHILDEYYSYWSQVMLEHTNRSPLITEKNCIEDWIVVNWAWELK